MIGRSMRAVIGTVDAISDSTPFRDATEPEMLALERALDACLIKVRRTRQRRFGDVISVNYQSGRVTKAWPAGGPGDAA